MTERIVELSYSDDGGRSWSAWKFRTVGLGAGDSPATEGLAPVPDQYRERAIFRRLGRSFDRIWRIRYTTPTKFELFGAVVQADT